LNEGRFQVRKASIQSSNAGNKGEDRQASMFQNKWHEKRAILLQTKKQKLRRNKDSTNSGDNITQR